MLKALYLGLPFLFIFSSFIQGAEYSRHKILGKDLSPFWAKEYIGMDLIADIMEQDKEQLSELNSVAFAVFDLGFEKDHITLSDGFTDITIPPQMNGRRTMRANHGTSVLSLLTGPEELRMENNGTLVGLAGIQFPGQYHYAFKNMEDRGVFPKVVSNSLGWNSERIPELVREVSLKGNLWVLAAGNSFPDPVKKLERDSLALLVGSFAPNGLTSYEAQIHENMVILAPANKELLTLDGYGKTHSFGASSGATPIVAATLINMSFYLPSLTREQAIRILKRTGWSSIENKLGFKNLPPLLNSFKAILMARSIFLECGADELCINEKVTKESIKVDLKFEWATEEKNLRAQALLKGGDDLLNLANYYDSQGLYWNAEFFKFLFQEKISLSKVETWTKEAIDEGLYEFNSFRYFPYYSKETKSYLKESSKIKDHHKGIYLGLKKEDIQGLN